MPLSRASNAMMCSREVNTTFPTATMPSLRIGSRITANALLPDLAIRRDIVRVANIQFIDLRFRDKFLNLDGSLTLNGHGFQLFAGHVNVFAFGELIALDDVGLVDVIAGLGVYLPVADPIAGLLVELMKADFLALGCRRVKSDRTRDER